MSALMDLKFDDKITIFKNCDKVIVAFQSKDKIKLFEIHNGVDDIDMNSLFKEGIETIQQQ